MFCPVCNHQETKVIDSRLYSEGDGVRRRRECDSCGFRFSTNEQVELLDITVIKRNGRREPYDRAKIERGLRHSLEKRPFTEASFRSLLSAIERDIQRLKSSEITSAQLGEVVMDRLRHFDNVAFIRFASVYRQFEDVASFSKELEALGGTRKKKH
jgi:transcriptional repressor NrdR